MKDLRALLIDCRIELRKLSREFQKSELCDRLDLAIQTVASGTFVASGEPPVNEAAPTGLSEKGQTASQVALAWQLAQGERLGLPVVPIPGTRKRHRIDENLGALSLDLSPAQLDALAAASDAVVGSRSADPKWVSEGRE